jgi:hypothetical protein
MLNILYEVTDFGGKPAKFLGQDRCENFAANRGFLSRNPLRHEYRLLLTSNTDGL